MTQQELAREIANGLINTGIEGGFGSVSCSTAGDYPSMGVQQVEGGRGDELLNSIDGGSEFAGRTYSDLRDSGDIERLSALLESDEGQQAQLEILTRDCLVYVEHLQSTVETLDNTRSMIYAGMWCPTSHYVVGKFLSLREQRGYDLRNLEILRDLFDTQYADAAGVPEVAQGYSNRALNTYNYVKGVEL
jgi:hypothetical protein